MTRDSRLVVALLAGPAAGGAVVALSMFTRGEPPRDCLISGATITLIAALFTFPILWMRWRADRPPADDDDEL